MNKILGLDIGQKRIGVAITEGKIVAPYGLIENSSLEETITDIGKICRKENIHKVIIGLPQSKKTSQADQIFEFAQKLKQHLNIEIDFVDETLTSVEAQRILEKEHLDPKSQRYKEKIDKLAATYILEQYLNR